MLIRHRDAAPCLDPTVWVAPDATICGDVRLGPHSRVMHGARLIAEAGAAISIGSHAIILENAVIRAVPRHFTQIGDHCLIGPGAHVVGARIANEVFIATGASVFHGAHVGAGCDIRINATVHLRSHLDAQTVVPIGWVAVGRPARILPPNEHARIWAIQKPLNFSHWVYGIGRDEDGAMRKITTQLAHDLSRHRDDRVLDCDSNRHRGTASRRGRRLGRDGMISGPQSKMARAALNLSIRELAASACISPATVNKFELTGRANVSTVSAIRSVLEESGISFIDDDETGGPGVRIRKP